MKKVLLGVVMAMVLLPAGWVQAVSWTEDFSTDPSSRWINRNDGHVWGGTESPLITGYYSSYGDTGYFRNLGESFTDSSSLSMSAKIMEVGAYDLGEYPRNEYFMGLSDGAANVGSAQRLGITLFAHQPLTYALYYPRITLRDANGVTHETAAYGADPAYIFRSDTLNASWSYNPTTRVITATLSVTRYGETTPLAPKTLTLTVDPNWHFTVNAAALSNYTSDATGWVNIIQTDDIVVSALNPGPTDVIGRVVLGGNFAGEVEGVGLTVDLWQGGQSVRKERMLLNADGTFTVPSVAIGTYTAKIKACAWLQQSAAVTVNGLSTVNLGTLNLVAGDADGSNAVNSTDLAIILANMDLTGN